ncbi:MAG: OsmC family protein [Candidatus Rokubacteria bacterium]|nr:OsmC family protein [Candidatus Rokubacteria bacterium]
MLYARRRGWTLDRIEARVQHEKIRPGGSEPGELAGGKRDTIALELLLGGDLTSEQEQRLREIVDRCPVHRALTGQVVITHG